MKNFKEGVSIMEEEKILDVLVLGNSTYELLKKLLGLGEKSE